MTRTYFINTLKKFAKAVGYNPEQYARHNLQGALEQEL